MRAFAWVLANVGIAFAVVSVGIAVAIAFDPEDPSYSLADIGVSFVLAAFLLPAYLPTVLLHGTLVPLLARRTSPRRAAFLLAPIAPGFLWYYVVLLLHPAIVGVAVGGTLAYGWLARLPGDRPVGAILVSSAIVLVLMLAFSGFTFVLIPAVVAFAIWGFRRQARTTPVRT